METAERFVAMRVFAGRSISLRGLGAFFGYAEYWVHVCDMYQRRLFGDHFFTDTKGPILRFLKKKKVLTFGLLTLMHSVPSLLL
jgi:hypothetical protein